MSKSENKLNFWWSLQLRTDLYNLLVLLAVGFQSLATVCQLERSAAISLVAAGWTGGWVGRTGNWEDLSEDLSAETMTSQWARYLAYLNIINA